MKRLAIITTHPIQYNAPLFALLSKRKKIAVKVFYTWGEAVMKKKYDPGFGKNIEWDIPLLEGYEYAFVTNKAKRPGSDHFFGIDNPTLIQDIQSWKADAILVYGWSFKSHLKTLRYFKNRIPVFFRGDSVPAVSGGTIKKAIRNSILKFVYKYVDVAFYVGTNNKRYFEEAGMKPTQLAFAGHAVDNDRFGNPGENVKAQIVKWKKELDIGFEKMVLLYAGKLDENKNVKILLDAFCQVFSEKAVLVIAGNGEKENELKEMYGGKKNIRFIPFQNQSNMPLLYALCDLFILPSLSETWGLGINEAMASGKAVMASDHCGAAIDIVQNGVNGFTFDPMDIADLVSKFRIIKADPELLSRFGQQSKNIIGHWNFENISLSIENETLKHTTEN